MDEIDFADMVEQTPVNTFVIEYREPSIDGYPGKLVGACEAELEGFAHDLREMVTDAAKAR